MASERTAGLAANDGLVTSPDPIFCQTRAEIHHGRGYSKAGVIWHSSPRWGSTSKLFFFLEGGFEAAWSGKAIPRHDVPADSPPCAYRRSLDAAGSLGLVLHFLSSTMLDVSLAQIFALVPATISCYLNFSLSILLSVLRVMPDSRIQWPTGDEFQALTSLVSSRHPLLTGAFGTMDGLNLPVQTV
jgi:hypothetical protein